MYQECSSCKEAYSINEMNQIGNAYYCSNCTNSFFNPVTRKEQLSKQLKNKKIVRKLFLSIFLTLLAALFVTSLIDRDWAVPYILIVFNIPFYYVSFKVFFPNIETLIFSIKYLMDHIKEPKSSPIPQRVKMYLGLLIVYVFINFVIYYFEELIVSIFFIFFNTAFNNFN